MNLYTTIGLLICAFVSGLLYGSVLYEGVVGKNYGDLKLMIEKCERPLPRTQTCILEIKAVPAEGNKQ